MPRSDKPLRKIAANGSDKATRSHARTIKALESRRVRRTDKASLMPDLEENADQITLEHRCTTHHWGTENAAYRRAASRALRGHYQTLGGGFAAQIENARARRNRTDSAQVAQLLNDTLAQLAAHKKRKD